MALLFNFAGVLEVYAMWLFLKGRMPQVGDRLDKKPTTLLGHCWPFSPLPGL